MTLPRLEIYGARIEENARAINTLIKNHGGSLAGVGKVLCAHPAVVDAMVTGGASFYADSRIDNLRQVHERNLDIELLLLRLPEPSRIADTVAYSDLALVSELSTMELLAAEARRQNKDYGAIVMVDLGDLREGVWDEQLIEIVVNASRLDGLRIRGIGCNLACYGGVVPSVENMGRLTKLLEQARQASGLDLEIVSGGNSSSLPMLAQGTMPSAVNHFRMGESIVLGRNVFNRDPWPGTRQDGVRLVAEVIEVQSKPSVPLGDAGQNAFGEDVTYVDRGIRRRAIVALGRQDVVPDGLEPTDPGMIVLGASSDHLIIDVEEAASVVKVGDEISFWPGYGATLALATSPYVEKVAM